MSISARDERIAELNRFLNDLEGASRMGPALLDRAFNAPPSGLSVHEINPDKKFTRVSPGHRALLGYGPAELVGRSPADYVVMRGIAESSMKRKFAPGAILLPLTRTYRKADGTEIILLLVERHLTDQSGHIVGIRTAMCEAPKAV